MPCTQSTFSCCTSLLKRSIVSLGEDSSSITSSILRPAMPPCALKRSTAHWVARIPFSPGAAAIPDRGARMPMRTGLFCAMAGPVIVIALAAAADCSSVRRETLIGFPPYCLVRGPLRRAFVSADDMSDACQQQGSGTVRPPGFLVLVFGLRGLPLGGKLIPLYPGHFCPAHPRLGLLQRRVGPGQARP